MNKQTILQRIQEIHEIPASGDLLFQSIVEKFQATVTLVVAVYGEDSPQLATLKDFEKKARTEEHGHTSIHYWRLVLPVVNGTLKAMKADVENGLADSLVRRGAGEALGDMVILAKDALSSDGGEQAKNIAAILVAASFEDTLRRLAATTAGGVGGRPDLQVIVNSLKTHGVLAGATGTAATGFLKFRNDALHADWGKVDRTVTASCLAFVEELLLKHFS